MKGSWRLLPGVLALLLLMMVALALFNLQQQLPLAYWSQALWQPDSDDVRQMLFHYSFLPRLVLALLAGAGLGLVGVLFQQVLRNPLAEPATLGVSAGAQLGITLVTLWVLPGGELTRQLAAIAGALLIGGLVLAVAWGKRLSPVTLILAGLVLGLYCAAVNNLLAIFNFQQLQGLFLWSSGALNQQDWSQVQQLLPALLITALLATLLLRPLTLIGLDDGVARNLGLSLSLARVFALLLAILFSALLVSATGVIGFIGLFSPLLARLLGARRLGQRLWLAPLIGALLLGFTDQVMIWLTYAWREVPTGAATALIGAPLLLWLLPRLRSGGVLPALNVGNQQLFERQALGRWALMGLLLLILTVVLAALLGRDAQGWHWGLGEQANLLLHWRWPRILAALSAGMMLAVAGGLIQKLTGNPMASPEVLGISSGAACAVLVLLFVVPGDAFAWLLPAGTLGAALTLLAIMLLAGRGGFSSARMLLAGIALSTVFSTLMTMMLASGDPRMGGVLTWLTGSTYRVVAEQAWRTALLALVLMLLAPLCFRWLRVLPLGSVTAQSVGLPLTRSRLLILLLAAALTAAATLTVGPLSFVGLMAPHMARMLGFRRALPQLIMAALLGGMLMVVADWAGRMLMFPYQIPAGLLATFIGAPYFIYLLRKL